LIEKLRLIGDLVDNIECGFKHVICKSTHQRIHTWGSGKLG